MRRPGVDENFSRASRATAVGLLALVIATLSTLATPAGTVMATEAPLVAAAQAVVAGSDEPAPTEPVATQPPLETQPPVTANDFIPEDRDLTSCIGALERPGCGSESRGGWHQTLVLIAIGIGLFVVYFNVVRGVRKTRRALDDQ